MAEVKQFCDEDRSKIPPELQESASTSKATRSFCLRHTRLEMFVCY